MSITAKQLQSLKANYANTLVGRLDISNIFRLAMERVASAFVAMDDAEFRDLVLSETNLEAWNALVESLPEEEAEDETGVSTEAEESVSKGFK